MLFNAFKVFANIILDIDDEETDWAFLIVIIFGMAIGLLWFVNLFTS